MPAFNEAAGIADTLGRLFNSSQSRHNLTVIVVANGCTDATADIARSFGVHVLEVPTPSKTAAMNAAEQVTEGDVRIYADADAPITVEL